MNKETHRIRNDYGITFARDMEGDFLDIQAMRELIVKLQSTLHMMDVTGLTQDRIRADAIGGFTQQILSSLNIQMPFIHPFAVFDPVNRPPRSPKEPRFCGVYFMQIDSRPQSIKIGQSIDLFMRSRALWAEYKETFRLVAFIETDEPQELEAAIHRTLNDFRINGEWFSLAETVGWLTEKMQ